MECEHMGRQKTHNGQMHHECLFVQAKAGVVFMVPESRCATCSQVDDGASFVSKIILANCRDRVCRHASFVSNVSREACAMEVLQRAGQAELETLLEQSVRNGTPVTDAEQMALTAGINLDAKSA